MMQKEDEAKDKWCPFVRVLAFTGGGSGFGANRSLDGWPAHASCIGSDCMAWRLERDSEGDRSTHIGEWKQAGAEPSKFPQPRGFCGLAGRP